MAVTLEGGCRVTEMRAGQPLEYGRLRAWPQVGRATGADAISLRVLEFAPGLSPGIRNYSCDEILYVLESDSEPENQGLKLFIDGWPFAVGEQTGIYLRAGQTLTVENPNANPINLISSQCPDPGDLDFIDAVVTPQSAAAPAPSMVRLADQRAQATADRWYRVLIDEAVGSTQVTQFVGSIPPGRAPDHFHTYEEVLFILRGTGRMWAGESNTEIGPGSCIYLPKGQVHCVENTGSDELRLLGVFYPAGSPAVRYDA